ncbi:DUF924 family protein [Vagococcus carniphilus]|uniref:DUF924 family protein n=1 Tax=Vagococcus carniphilus TaxID=218144 RepID=UPI00288D7100|nr:DUF924 family protein [Vagococcus carniphilus]MDT2815782.1 DUF924 domain-containing protein [Vagococcus carniphilus]MDT2866223.1 DUF924 domain-containing protein [Vagococcus carniphilus]
MNYQDILTFWFNEITAEQRFKKDEAFDELLRERFGELHESVSKGEAFSWRESIQGRLAEVIVLDQFSRNLFRGKPESFKFDGMSLVLAQEAIRTGEINQLTLDEKAFLFMPFMHSESSAIHEIAVTLFSEEGMETYLDFEHRHFDIIKRFGRYPHRNEILKRESTAEEVAFLKEPNSSF